MFYTKSIGFAGNQHGILLKFMLKNAKMLHDLVVDCVNLVLSKRLKIFVGNHRILFLWLIISRAVYLVWKKFNFVIFL